MGVGRVCHAETQASMTFLSEMTGKTQQHRYAAYIRIPPHNASIHILYRFTITSPHFWLMELKKVFWSSSLKAISFLALPEPHKRYNWQAGVAGALLCCQWCWHVWNSCGGLRQRSELVLHWQVRRFVSVPVLTNHITAVEFGSPQTVPFRACVQGRCSVHTLANCVQLARAQMLDFGHRVAGLRVRDCQCLRICLYQS